LDILTNTTFLIVVGLLLIGVHLYLLARYCTCCGHPKTLTASDVTALETFKELYDKLDVKTDEMFLMTKELNYLNVRTLTVLAEPSVKWGDTFEKAVTAGFLSDRAEKVNGLLQAFQYEVWEEVGDWASNLPVVAIAQEWRRWVANTMHRLRRPTPETKAEIRRRSELIDACRNITFVDIVDLRATPFWVTPESLSLLGVLRDEVKPVLDGALDTWDTYAMQESVGYKLRELSQYLAQAAKECLRVLEVILRTDDICIASRVLSFDGPPDFKPKSQFDVDLLKLCGQVYKLLHRPGDVSAPGLVPEAVADADADQMVLHVEQAGGKSDHLLGSSIDDLLKGLSKSERERFARYRTDTKPDKYGMTRWELDITLLQYVLLQSDTEALAACGSLVRYLSKFAASGGELFLLKALDKTHLAEVMARVRTALTQTMEASESLAMNVQRGWENLRAANKEESFWSSNAPVDNVRCGLAAARIVQNGVPVGMELLSEMLSKADKFATEHGSGELNKEVAAYMQAWKAFQDRFFKAVSTRPFAQLLVQNKTREDNQGERLMGGGHGTRGKAFGSLSFARRLGIQGKPS